MRKQKWNEAWEFYCEEQAESRKTVDLPYDAMIYEKRQPRCINAYNTGYYPGGRYVYTKRFPVEKKEHMVVEFEGVFGITEVYLNGKKMEENVYGYTDFFVPLDSALMPGQENVLTVNVDNSIEDVSRWYSGSGIYRDVNLYTSEDLFIQPETLNITPISVEEGAVLKVSSIFENQSKKAQINDVKLEIYYQGQLVKNIVDICKIPPESTWNYESIVFLENPHLWSAENPELYEIKLEIAGRTAELKDYDSAVFGIRKLEWDAKNGFLVNGKEIKLRGGCVHHDNGMLGANTDIQTERRRVKKMKEAGFNAIRSAHNPIGKLLLQACDELGMYVMDESFDVWYKPKGDNYFQYCRYFNEWWKKDTQAMVRKDYNHPSVIMYSIGNEIFETAFDKGIQLAEQMRNAIRQIDQTRPVTCCVNLFMNGMAKEDNTEVDYASLAPKRGERNFEEEYTSSKEFNIMMNNMKEIVSEQVVSPHVDQATREVFTKLDISGYNYGVERYELDQELHPERVIVGSETVACDVDKNWKAVMKHKNVIGDFIWTAYDHLGECGIGVIDYEDMQYYKSYPFRTSGTGVIGINGNFTPLAYFTQIVYGIRKAPYLVVEPYDRTGEERSLCALKFTNGIHSWDWKNCEGRSAKVFVLCNAYSVELYRNGELLEKKRVMDRAFVDFEVIYEPGILSAKAYDNDGKCIGEDQIETPSDIRKIVVEPEIDNKKRGSLIYVPIRLEDEKGNIHNINNERIYVEVSGAKLIALGTEAPSSEEDFHGKSTVLYQGQAMTILKVLSDDAEIQMEVSCNKCMTVNVTM